MEPEAVNTLAEEAGKMKEEVLESLSGNPPDQIKYIFSDMSSFFQDEVISKWRIQERFDELIDYILYQHDEHGGENLWQQVLIDLRLKKDEVRGSKLLDGLYPGRVRLFWIALENYKKHPDNHFCAAAFDKAKGEVMKVLYEHSYLLENKVEKEQNLKLVEMTRTKINEIHNAKIT